MRSPFEPQTRILGVNKTVDPETGKLKWDMPEPVEIVKHKRYARETVVHPVTGERQKVKVAIPIDVPIYRGMSASLFRYLRGHAIREMRKAQIVEQKNSQEKEKKDD